MAARKMSESFQSISSAITVAPTARNGARTTSRMSMATASWSWLTSPTMRVMSDGVPIRSSSAWERLLIFRNRSRRSAVPTPWEATDAKYWQVSELASPTTPSSTMTPPMRRT